MNDCKNISKKKKQQPSEALISSNNQLIIVGLKFSLTALYRRIISSFSLHERKEQVEIGNVKTMHECFPKHLHMRTARVKTDIETVEEGKKRRLNKERGTADTKKEVPTSIPHTVPSYLRWLRVSNDNA